MSDIKVKIKGIIKSFPKGITYKEISDTLPDKDDIIGLSVNNRISSLADKCEQDCDIEFFKVSDTDGNS